jgi:hypothetical protein
VLLAPNVVSMMRAMHHSMHCIINADRALAGNEFQSEALPGALPHGQNNPRVSKQVAQRCDQSHPACFVTALDACHLLQLLQKPVT